MSEEIKNIPQEENLSELLQIRRDKLKALQDAGQDPFQITKYDVSHPYLFIDVSVTDSFFYKSCVLVYYAVSNQSALANIYFI